MAQDWPIALRKRQHSQVPVNVRNSKNRSIAVSTSVGVILRNFEHTQQVDMNDCMDIFSRWNDFLNTTKCIQHTNKCMVGDMFKEFVVFIRFYCNCDCQ